MNLAEFKATLKKSKLLLVIGPISPQIPKKLLTFPQLFVDGGTKLKKKNSHHFSLGDGDSLGKVAKNQLDHVLPTKKDYSDFKFALSIIPPSLKEVYLTGFLGKRKDHELVNLGEVHQFLKKKKSTKVHFLVKNQIKMTAFSNGKYNFSRTGNFSVVTLEPCSITLNGKCEYKILKKRLLPALSSLGLSNIGFGKIKLKTSRPVFVIFED